MIEAGTRLGSYEILSPLGAGGMGEVYRARDTKLGREVAIKVLPEEFTQHPQKLARFEREAKLLAALNHPGIATLHGLEESEGKPFLVMELVEGQTLADRISQGPIPVGEALELSLQIAEALEAAHEKGVIHRDLKPANIKVDPEGKVKVLDFGLAKAFAEEVPESELSQSPTLSRDATRAGVILGTAAYMSPEQAKGKTVDKRTDIFSFGIVLFEMLTGKKAFKGEDVPEVLARIIGKEPEWEALPRDLDSRIDGLVRRCLRKDRKLRRQSIGDVRVELHEIVAQPTAASETVKSGTPSLVWRLAVPVAALLSALLVWTVRRPEPPSELVMRFSIALPPSQTFTTISRHVVAFSPDGTRLVYAANNQLYLREVDQLEAEPIRGTDVGPLNPFFSPDGQWVGFHANGNLRKISVSGGAPVTLCEADPPFGASWGADDTIIFAEGTGGVLRVSADGGTPETLIPMDSAKNEYAHGPQMLPDGKTVLFTLRAGGTWDEAQIVAQSLETGARSVLIEGGSDARYVPTGHLVYALGDTLLAVPFDVSQLQVTIGPVPIVEGVARADVPTGAAHASFSHSGSLVYVPDILRANRTLVWVDREGEEEAIAAGPRAYVYPRISPDGRRVALDVRDLENDIWIWDISRQTLRRLTFGPERDTYPAWTPNGLQVAFGSDRGGGPNIYSKAADGAGTVEQLTDSQNNLYPYVFSPDGEQLLYRASQSGGGFDLGVLRRDGDDSSKALLTTEYNEINADLSPNGQWLVYQSNATGQYEVYVSAFPNLDQGSWQISRGGGTEPLWSRDGSELFYLDQDRRLMAVPVELDSGFEFGNAVVVLNESSSPFPNAPGRTYDATSDGKRFLMIKDTGESRAYSLNVVVNWFEELKRLVPTD